MSVTLDLSKFGYRELEMARKLLQAKIEQGLPEDFEDEELQISFNDNSGFVFFTNSQYQAALMNGDKLEMWYSCPECGHEGFKEDMWHESKSQECVEYLGSIGVEKAVA